MRHWPGTGGITVPESWYNKAGDNITGGCYAAGSCVTISLAKDAYFCCKQYIDHAGRTGSRAIAVIVSKAIST